MKINLEELYEQRKKDITYEIYFIEGIQYNFKLEDIQNLIGVTKDNLKVFKKYIYYLDVYRCNFFYIENIADGIDKFNLILDEKENDRELLTEMFKKQENLFCNKEGKMKLELVPRKYDVRIFNGYEQLKTKFNN